MGGLTILHNSAPIVDVTPGWVAPPIPGFTVAPAAREGLVQGLPGSRLQIRADGVDVGDANPAVINVVADPARILVTRGVGEKSHVATLRAIPLEDPFIDDVILLAHMDSDFSDSSTYNVTPTVVGATIDPDSQYGDGAGTTGGVSGRRVTYVGAHLNLNLYPDWTIEINRKRLATIGAPLFLVGMNPDDPTNTYSWYIGEGVAFADPYFIRWIAYDGALAQAVMDQVPGITPGYTNGDRYSIAVTKQGSTYRLFLDGLLQATATWAGLMYESPEPPAVQLFYQTIGVPVLSSNDVLDELRITAACRYTSNFTPPIGPFPNP